MNHNFHTQLFSKHKTRVNYVFLHRKTVVAFNLRASCFVTKNKKGNKIFQMRFFYIQLPLSRPSTNSKKERRQKICWLRFCLKNIVCLVKTNVKFLCCKIIVISTDKSTSIVANVATSLVGKFLFLFKIFWLPKDNKQAFRCVTGTPVQPCCWDQKAEMKGWLLSWYPM